MSTRSTPAGDEPVAGVLLEDPRWAGGRVRPPAREELLRWSFGALVLGVLLAPTVARFDRVLEWSVFGAWGLVTIMGLIELHLVYGCVLHTLAWRRYGSLELELDPFPASPGGEAGGWIDLPLEELEADACRVTIQCVEVRTTRSGGSSRSRWESVVWSREHVPEVRSLRRGSRLGFTFQLPADVRLTQAPGESTTTWSVRVEVRVRGFDLDRVFELPVLAASEPLRAATPAKSAPPMGGAANELLPPAAGVIVSPSVNGVRLDYPPLRSAKGGLTALGFGAVFSSIGLGFALHVAGESGGGAVDSAFTSLFVLAFGGLGALLLSCGVWMLVNGLEVELDGRELRARRSFLLRGSERRVAVADVERVVLSIASQLGQGARARLTYRCQARLKTGGVFTLGDGILGTPAAEGLARLVTRVTGLTAEIDSDRRPPPTALARSKDGRAA